jgi:ribosomal protein S18 acetylase RimI-like enzyme
VESVQLIDMSIRIRAVESADQEAWQRLYTGYRRFYRLDDDANAVATTWGWVSRGEHSLQGIVAADDDGLRGFANLRWFARPSSATIGLYLDDLFTDPDARGRGVGSALLTEAARIAAERDASVVRWITAADNATARRLYDTVATATPWVTYDMAPGVR